MSKKGTMDKAYIMTQVRLGDLYSSQSYQRPIVKKHVAKIIREFDPIKLDPIKVVRKGNRYYVYDGQHRVAACRTLFGNNYRIPAQVYDDISYQYQAKLFAEQDDVSKKLTVNEKMKALYESGDPYMVRFHDIVTEYGFNCNFEPAGVYKNNNRVGAYKTLYNDVFLRKGEDRLRTILKIVVDAYGVITTCTQKYMIQGLNVFLDTYEGEYRYERLIKALSYDTPVAIKNAGDVFKNLPPQIRYGRAILDKYNYRVVKHLQLPVRL